MRRLGAWLGAAALTGAAMFAVFLGGEAAKQVPRSREAGRMARSRTADDSALLRILSPPGAGYDSTNVALTTGSGLPVTVTRASEQRCPDTSTIRTVATNKPCVQDNAALLVEPNVTNLILQSEDFATTWVSTGSATSVTANTTTAPDGAATADLITDNNTAAGTYGRNQTVGVSASTTYTWSAHVKQRDYQYAYLQCAEAGGTNHNRGFDLANGTLATLNTNTVSAAMYAAPQGFYRVVMTYTTTATPGANQTCQVFHGNATASTSHTGVVGTGQHVWGAQLETGFVASSYVPTTTVTAARASQVTTAANPLSGNTDGTWCLGATIEPANSAWNNGNVSFEVMALGSLAAANSVRIWIWQAGTPVLEIHDAAGARRKWEPSAGVMIGSGAYRLVAAQASAGALPALELNGVAHTPAVTDATGTGVLGTHPALFHAVPFSISRAGVRIHSMKVGRRMSECR